jgi:hypothetical protein
MQSGKKARAMNNNKNQNPNSGPKGKNKGGGKAKKGPKQGSFASRNGNKQFSAAAAYSTGNSGKAPNVTMSKDSCRVIHRELLGNVSGVSTSAFTISSTFALNPGIVATFPWLSNIAQNWEAYRFNKLRVCYYTRTGSNTAGSVIMVPDYDASDGSPISEQTASSYEDIQEDVPWKDITCTLRPGAMHSVGPRKFVRLGALSANQDIKLYDVGNLFICTVDSAAAAPWGKVWIEYDVTFYTPQLQSGGSTFTTVSAIRSGGTMDNLNVFGDAPVITGNLGVTVAANVMTFPTLIVGAEYNIDLSLTGTTISAINSGVPVGMTLKTTCFLDFNAAGTKANMSRTFTATAVSGSMAITCTAASITAGQTIFSMIPTSSF